MTALIVVDAQVDFVSGSLPVPGGDQVCKNIATLINQEFDKRYATVIFTQDWHNPDSDNGGHFSDTPDFKDTWPSHCVAFTPGAEIHPALLEMSYHAPVFQKGWNKPAYSGFEGFCAFPFMLNYMGTIDELLGGELLGIANIDAVDVCGIAAEYCVRATALDAIRLDYNTTVLGEEYTAGFGGTKTVQEEIEALNG